MAKKSRTPQPPRRPQGPKRRDGKAAAPRPGDVGARHRALLYGIAGSGIVALAIVVAVIVLAGGGGESAAAAIKTIQVQGCTYRRYPALPRIPHYTTLHPNPPPQWNSFPPTSGRHYYQPVPFGQYSQVLPEIRLVHNLEHGAVILQYGDKVPQAQIEKITEWYRKDANAIVVAPLPQLGGKTALTSWTEWSECRGFNEKAANAFRSAFRYHAPEHYPKSYLEPGQ